MVSKLILPESGGGAILDDKRIYRYALWRRWELSKPWVLFIGLNPSTADEAVNDRTLDRCIAYAKLWDYGGVYMANLFAYRATDPKAMKQAVDPIGLDNDKWLASLYSNAGLVVAAWGNDGNYMLRADNVRSKLANMCCLKINASGEPAHPLYQPGSAMPIKYQ